MGRIKDYMMGLQEIYPDLSDQELIDEQRRRDNFIENCIEQEREGDLDD